MNRLLNLTSGKKTYIVAIATLVFAVAGVFLGQLDVKEAIELVLGALGVASLRHGMSK